MLCTVEERSRMRSIDDILDSDHENDDRETSAADRGRQCSPDVAANRRQTDVDSIRRSTAAQSSICIGSLTGSAAVSNGPPSGGDADRNKLLYRPLSQQEPNNPSTVSDTRSLQMNQFTPAAHVNSSQQATARSAYEIRCAFAGDAGIWPVAADFETNRAATDSYPVCRSSTDAKVAGNESESVWEMCGTKLTDVCRRLLQDPDDNHGDLPSTRAITTIKAATLETAVPRWSDSAAPETVESRQAATMPRAVRMQAPSPSSPSYQQMSPDTFTFATTVTPIRIVENVVLSPPVSRGPPLFPPEGGSTVASRPKPPVPRKPLSPLVLSSASPQHQQQRQPPQLLPKPSPPPVAAKPVLRPKPPVAKKPQVGNRGDKSPGAAVGCITSPMSRSNAAGIGTAGNDQPPSKRDSSLNDVMTTMVETNFAVHASSADVPVSQRRQSTEDRSPLPYSAVNKLNLIHGNKSEETLPVGLPDVSGSGSTDRYSPNKLQSNSIVESCCVENAGTYDDSKSIRHDSAVSEPSQFAEFSRPKGASPNVAVRNAKPPLMPPHPRGSFEPAPTAAVRRSRKSESDATAAELMSAKSEEHLFPVCQQPVTDNKRNTLPPRASDQLSPEPTSLSVPRTNRGRSVDLTMTGGHGMGGFPRSLSSSGSVCTVGRKMLSREMVTVTTTREEVITVVRRPDMQMMTSSVGFDNGPSMEDDEPPSNASVSIVDRSFQAGDLPASRPMNCMTAIDDIRLDDAGIVVGPKSGFQQETYLCRGPADSSSATRDVRPSTVEQVAVDQCESTVRTGSSARSATASSSKSTSAGMLDELIDTLTEIAMAAAAEEESEHQRQMAAAESERSLSLAAAAGERLQQQRRGVCGRNMSVVPVHASASY